MEKKLVRKAESGTVCLHMMLQSTSLCTYKMPVNQIISQWHILIFIGTNATAILYIL